jgi:hypothetical protein
MVIEIKPEEFQKEVLESSELTMLLVWSKFSGDSIIMKAMQTELEKEYGDDMRFASMDALEITHVNQIFPIKLYHVPQCFYLYRGRVIQSSFYGSKRDFSIQIRAHLHWVTYYFEEHKPMVVPDEHTEPEAAGWCTPGYNC